MATRKPGNTPPRDVLPGEEEIARLYQVGGHEMPPPELDRRITSEAYRTVTLLHRPHRRWAVPLSTAAVVVLAVSVVLLMTREGTLDRNGSLTAPNEYSMPPVAEAPASPPTLTGSRVAEPAKPAAAPVADAAESTLAKQAPAEARKQAEVPAAAAPIPQVLGRTQEADRMTIAREEKSRARLATTGAAAMKTPGADVIAVAVRGSPGAYSFNVTVKSPDTGCQQYADWWEVVSEDGRLLYRRVLLHSHVSEQPFTRDGGAVPIQPETVVWVRAHMNTSGYGGAVLKGSVKSGFKQVVPDAGFATGLAKQPPLPDGCDF